MSFAYLSHVSLILVGNTIAGEGKRRRGNLNLYIRKNTNFTIFEGIFTENLNFFFLEILSLYRGQGHPPSEYP